MLSFITLPTPTTLFSGDQIAGIATDTEVTSLSDYATSIFGGLAPVALAVTGLIIGALFVRFIVLGGLKGGVQKLIGRGKRGRRRR